METIDLPAVIGGDDMKYKVSSSERASASAAETETKAMLHLICYDDNQDGITNFAIDFFNDVTGMDRLASHLYDVQSKGSGTGIGPKGLGEDLVTLYKNYVSEFRDYFVKYILFVQKVTSTVKDDPELSEFKFTDMKDEAQKDVRASLIKACKDKTYIDNSKVTDASIDTFLSSVTFVVSKPDREDYIRPLVMNNVTLSASDEDMRAIFNEIRKKQAGIKTNCKVEGVELTHPDQVFRYNRVIRRSDIVLLAISRIINTNPLEQRLPKPFASIYSGIAEDERDEVIEKCQTDLAKQMCNVNELAQFWSLLAAIVSGIRQNPSADVETVYRSIDPNILEECSGFEDALSYQYFIAIVKGGLKVG